ncbi:NAD(P) transhydrogenase alpha subunit [invertebrate metagenome]|uniref:proton-translocating NAD(P)(+) transhydrogenase n=1 Tax=invertebrate metagenome TaxID=1711999 RepID=A0A484H540_9ZZZZ
MEGLVEGVQRLVEQAGVVAKGAESLAAQAKSMQTAVQAAVTVPNHGDGMFLSLFTVFVLAVFVGYYVVWRVTPALHSPLMAVTNAVSSVIIVGAILAAGPVSMTGSKWLGFMAVILASVNIFGGFTVTQRMLAMFKKKGK